MWKLKTGFTGGEIERTFAAHRGIIRTLCLFNSCYPANGGEDNTVRIWNLADGSALAQFHYINFVQSITADPHNQLVSASYDGQVKA